MNLKESLSKVSKFYYKSGESVTITGGYNKSDPTYPSPPHTGYDNRARSPLELFALTNRLEVLSSVKGTTGYGNYVHLYDKIRNITYHFAQLSDVYVREGISIILVMCSLKPA